MKGLIYAYAWFVLFAVLFAAWLLQNGHADQLLDQPQLPYTRAWYGKLAISMVVIGMAFWIAARGL